MAEWPPEWRRALRTAGRAGAGVGDAAGRRASPGSGRSSRCSGTSRSRWTRSWSGAGSRRVRSRPGSRRSSCAGSRAGSAGQRYVAELREEDVAGRTSLVVVESPTKVKTIQKYLDRGYMVKASLGHVKDLPKSKLGIDVKKGFEPQYVARPDKKKMLDELKKAGKKAKALYIATDPDREGEAIGWHIAQELGLPPEQRLPRALQRDHRAGGQGRLQEPGPDRPEARSTPSRRGACSTGWSATRSARCSGSKVRRGPVGRPRPVGGGAADLRARAGDPGLRARRSTGRSTPTWPRPCRPSSSRRSGRRPGEKLVPSTEAETQAIVAELERRAVRGQDGRPGRAAEEPVAAVHHLDPPAGRRRGSSASRRQEDDDGRPAALRGRRASATRARSASSPTCAPTRRGWPPRRRPRPAT